MGVNHDIWEEVSYIRVSKNREEVLRRLVEAGRPMTPTELGNRMEIVVKSASRAVRQLHDHGLVRCVNPEARRDRRYRATSAGRTIWAMRTAVVNREEPPRGGNRSRQLLRTYRPALPDHLAAPIAYVRRSPNRKAVLRRLAYTGIPLTPAELSDDLGIPFNSASRALLQLADRGLVRCITPAIDRGRRYGLTAEGEALFRDSVL